MGSKFSKGENDIAGGRKYLMSFSDNNLSELDGFVETNDSSNPLSVKYSKTFDTAEGSDESSNSNLSWHEEEHSVNEKETHGTFWTSHCWGCINRNEHNGSRPNTPPDTNATRHLSINQVQSA